MARKLIPRQTIICWALIISIMGLGEGLTRSVSPAPAADLHILALLSKLRCHSLDTIFMAVTAMGSNSVLLPLALVWAIILLSRKHTHKAIFLASACWGASLLVNFCKPLIRRPRPTMFPALIDLPSGSSFPSGHATQITAFVLATLLLLKSNSPNKGWLTSSATLGGMLVFFVSLSRLYLQVHYPSDVLAGILVGACWVIGLAGLLLPPCRSNDNVTKP